MNKFRLLLFTLFLLSTQLLKAQTFVYSYTDPCTGLLKSMNVPSNGVTVTYFGQIQTFNPNDFQNGVFDAWAYEVYNSFGNQNPCGSIFGVSTSIDVAQGTALNFISIINNISAIADLQQSMAGPGGSLNTMSAIESAKSSSGKKDKKDKKDKNSNTTNQSSVNNSQSNSTNTEQSQSTGSSNESPVVTNSQSNNSGQTNNTNSVGESGNNSNSSNSQNNNSTSQSQNNEQQNNSVSGNSTSNTNNQSNQSNVTTEGSTQTNSTTQQNESSPINSTGQLNQTTTQATSNNQNQSSENQNNSGNQSSQENNQNSNQQNSESNENGSSSQNSQSSSTENNQSSQNSQSNNQTENNSGQNEATNNTSETNTSNGNTQNTNNQQSGSNGSQSNNETPNGSDNATQNSEDKKTNFLGGTVKSTERSTESNKPQIVLSSDFAGFNFKSGEVEFGGKGTAGYTALSWDGRKSYGVLLDYTSIIRGPNVTGFYANIAKKRIDLISLTGTFSFYGRGSQYASLAVGQMWNINKSKSLKAIYMATASFGNVYGERFLGTAFIAGGMYDWRVHKRIDVKIMNLFIYAPYVSYYNDILLKSPYVIMPIVGTNIGITKKFKFNVNFGGAYAINENVMNFTLMFGTRLAI
jgi:hypothetical protein